MFSIVMLTYNNHQTFHRCISTITPLLLDPRVKEMIILDNGSHEIELLNLLKNVNSTFDKIRVIFSGENMGIAKGRKFLYDLTSEEYILSFDSDIMIVNSQFFLEMFLQAINKPDIWLVGGGGGNHIFFPTIFRTDIHNLETPEKGKIAIVDEVAGWFHGFPSKILTKNGGKVYMDERFTPFWGEDSDFCYQIKLLGGKCCILGEGCLGHAWSSCDKKDVQSTIEVMWKKMTDKWYPQFGELFDFEFDEKFYKANYLADKDIYDVKEYYFLEGMRRGDMPSKKHIKKLYPVEFIDHTQLKYKDYQYNTRVFIDKFFNRKEIVKSNYKVIKNNLKNDNYVVFISSLEQGKSLRMIEMLYEKNGPFTIIVCAVKEDHSKIANYLEKNFQNYYLSEFPNYHDHMIPYIITMGELKDYTFGNVLKIPGEKIIEEFDLSKLHSSVYEKNKDNNFVVDIILDYFRYSPTEYYKDQFFSVSHAKLMSIINSFPIENILELALRLPTKYSYNVSPRFCPRLAIDKLFNQMLGHTQHNKSLVLYMSDIQDKDMVCKNNQIMKNNDCDILMLNTGEEKFYSFKDLNCDYYYVIKKEDFIYFNWFSILGVVKLDNYDNIIFMKDGYAVENCISEFISHSKWHNINLIKTKNEEDINMFSFVKRDVLNFAGMVQEIHNKSKKDKDININKTININIDNNFGMRYLWIEKRTETEDTIEIEYIKFKDKFEPTDDFPLCFEDI